MHTDEQNYYMHTYRRFNIMTMQAIAANILDENNTSSTSYDHICTIIVSVRRRILMRDLMRYWRNHCGIIDVER